MSARFARAARTPDAAAIARITRAAWSSQPWLAAAAESMSEADLTSQWLDLLTDVAFLTADSDTVPGRDLLATPFVATDNDDVVGWLLTARADNHDDAHELVDFAINPSHQRRGHGSRLVQAAADHARANGSTWLLAWCPLPDEARRAFLISHGFAPDGALRELSDGDNSLTEVRLVAQLSDGDTE